jgi:hypothetical protein
MAEGLRHLTPAPKGRSDQESANYGPSRVCDKIQRTREPIVKKQQLAQLDAARDNKPKNSELPQVFFGYARAETAPNGMKSTTLADASTNW